MAKIATAHIEIKPVLDEDALERVCQVIEQRVRAAYQRGMTTPLPSNAVVTWPPRHPSRDTTTPGAPLS